MSQQAEQTKLVTNHYRVEVNHFQESSEEDSSEEIISGNFIFFSVKCLSLIFVSVTQRDLFSYCLS